MRVASVTSPSGTRRRYSPRALVRAPMGIPTTPTDASGIGSLDPARVTRPLTSRCADAAGAITSKAAAAPKRVVNTYPPECRWREGRKDTKVLAWGGEYVTL